jgi:predicted esterase
LTNKYLVINTLGLEYLSFNSALLLILESQIKIDYIMRCFILIVASLGVFFCNAQNTNYCDGNLFTTAQFTGIPRSISNVTYGKAKDFSNKEVTLSMNIYLPQPVTSSATPPLRPLLVWIHGGAFIFGNKNDMNPFAATSATNGYVSATVSYRLGLANYNPDNCKNAWAEFLRAGYRATQDVKNAIQFLKQNASTYSIDTTQIFVAGYSAGAITALNVAYADAVDMLPFENYINDLGTISKTTNIRGVLSIAGALLDDCFMDTNEKIPVFVAHGTCDEVVPYDLNPILFCPNFPKITGGIGIAKRAQCMDIPYKMFSIEGLKHNIFFPLYVPTMIVDSAARYFKRVAFCNQKDDVDCIANVASANACAKPALTCPDGCLSTACTVVGTKENLANPTIGVKLFPNPANEVLHLELNEPCQLAVFDQLGRLVLRVETLQQQYSINIAQWQQGAYLLSLSNNHTIINQRFIKD